MKENNAKIMSKISPDLFVSPHVLSVLMESFAGERPQALLQQEHLLAHLEVCHYCRTAIVFLLDVEQEYDSKNNEPEEPAHDLLVRFANISRAIEVREYERMGAYAEAIAAEGRDKADLHFPDVVAHLRRHPEYRSVLKVTVDSITGSGEMH